MKDLVDQIPQQGITPIKTPRVTQDTVRYQTPDKSQRKPKRKKPKGYDATKGGSYTEYETEERMKALIEALKHLPGQHNQADHAGKGHTSANEKNQESPKQDSKSAQTASEKSVIDAARAGISHADIKKAVGAALEEVNWHSELEELGDEWDPSTGNRAKYRQIYNKYLGHTGDYSGDDIIKGAAKGFSYLMNKRAARELRSVVGARSRSY